MISRKTDYALRSLVYLAGRERGEWVSTTELSRQLNAPRGFLAKIFQALIRRRILASGRGKNGGVRLRRQGISLLEVIQALEPTFSLNKCLDGEFTCFMERDCSVHNILGGVQKELFNRLKGITLQAAASRSN